MEVLDPGARGPRLFYLPATLLRILGTAFLLAAILLPWAHALHKAGTLSPSPGQTRNLRPPLLVLPENLKGQPPRHPFALSTSLVSGDHQRAALPDLPVPMPPDPATVARYCDRLSDLEGWPRCPPATADCLGYRLPTREELRYAALADQDHPADESPNRWGLSDLQEPERLLALDGSPKDPLGFLIARTCPAPPAPCGRPLATPDRRE